MINNNFPLTSLLEYEQYFFTENVLIQLTDIFQYEKKIICLCTPAVADAFYRLKNKEVLCLDIDNRFNYLPKFIYTDINDIINNINKFKIPNDYINPDLIIVDPPFFKMNLNNLYKFIDLLTNKNKKTKIIFAFIIRKEKELLNTFKDYNLKLTKFKLEYNNVDKTKWENYGNYSNFQQEKIKFIK